MKRRIIFALLALLLPLFALAQKGLHANAAFTGQIVPQDQTVEVKVRGRALSVYRLTFYHSVRFNANAQQKNTMDNLVEKDKAQANSTELRRKGHTSSLILCLPPQGRTHRYLCYLTNGSKGHWSITLVYMEGSVSSIDELRKLIN
uniref:DUF6108 family protein n=1 Tax=Prevotella sp. TaxID=59823 RepID=UPI004029EFBC